MPLKVILFGTNGQVGREFAAIAENDPAIDLVAAPRELVDLSVAGAASDFIQKHHPDAIVNAAAYTAVDKAETDQDLAWRLNAEAPGEIASAANEVEARLVHISTDYVFPGTTDKLLVESSLLDPVNFYGSSKLAGEVKVQNTCANAVTLRTSWVFSAHGSNFVKTMLRLAETHRELTVVADQIGGPTSAASIAATCRRVIDPLDGPTGVFHFQGAPQVSWAEFARAVFEQAGQDVIVKDIPTSDYPTPAQRPLTTRLDCSAIKDAFSIEQPDWRSDLTEVMTALSTAAKSKEASTS